jgi:hypothetical protein
MAILLLSKPMTGSKDILCSALRGTLKINELNNDDLKIRV